MRILVAETPDPDRASATPNQGRFLSSKELERLKRLTGHVGTLASLTIWKQLAQQFPHGPDPETLTYEYGVTPPTGWRNPDRSNITDRSPLSNQAMERFLDGLRKL